MRHWSFVKTIRNVCDFIFLQVLLALSKKQITVPFALLELDSYDSLNGVNRETKRLTGRSPEQGSISR